MRKIYKQSNEAFHPIKLTAEKKVEVQQQWISSSGVVVCSSIIEPRNHHDCTVSFAVLVVYCSLMCSAEENLKLTHICLVFAVEC